MARHSQQAILDYCERRGLKVIPADPTVIAEYERSMREETIPAIEAAIKAQARAAHYLRLGVPDPAQGMSAGTAKTEGLGAKPASPVAKPCAQEEPQ